MATSSISIPLSEELRAYVDAQVTSGEYDTTGDFVRDLIADDREHCLAKLDRQLGKALRSESFELPLDEIPEGKVVTFLRQRLNRTR